MTSVPCNESAEKSVQIFRLAVWLPIIHAAISSAMLRPSSASRKISSAMHTRIFLFSSTEKQVRGRSSWRIRSMPRAAVPNSRLSWSTVPPCLTPYWRANSSVMKKERLPVPNAAANRVCLNWPTAERCFWTKSETSATRFSCVCCAFWMREK